MSWVQIPPGAPQENYMEHYKSFREQFLECKKNGNLISINISIYGPKIFPENILVCIKYKSVCYSGVCKDERIKKT